MGNRPLLCISIDEVTELRIYEERHAQEVAELVDQNRTYLRQWLCRVDNSRAAEDSRAFIRSSPEQFAHNEGFQMGIWYKDKLVGGIGYHQIDWAERKVEIGYWLGESLQGKGLMTKACRTLLTYAFAELGLNKVEIHCAAENRRSCAIPKRLGFTQEGINDYFVTTPHSYKPRASAVTLVCRTIPSFVPTTEARPCSTQLLSRFDTC